VPWGTITATGWASGLNLWGTALLLGLAGRLGWAETPAELQQTWVLVVLGALYAVEFVIDKVPWLDSAWDVANTAIRPLGGALLAAALAQDAGSTESVAALLGGTFALTAHGAKASTRAAINTSPEPFSNVLASLTEDGIVAAMVALALAYPVAAGIVAVTFALASVVVIWMFFKAGRVLFARWRERRAGSVPT
jgi:hypothetical protein